MNGNSLDAFMQKDRHTSSLFAGVFASDTLPYSLHQKPALIIVNTDPHTKPGAHWQAIFIGSDGRGEHFCSYGLGPYVPKIRRFMDRQCSVWTKNTIDLQSFDSSVCGQYCALYLLYKAHGLTLEDFLSCFTANCADNDYYVNLMFNQFAKNVKLCEKTLLKQTQSCCKKIKCKTGV